MKNKRQRYIKVVMNLRQKKNKIDMKKERVYIERCCYYC